MNKILISLLLLISTYFSVLQAEDTLPKFKLPKVLIIGDSISIGYTPYVSQLLNGKAIIKHNTGNASHTRTGLEKLDEWLEEEKWDVIHFNWGLLDINHLYKKTNTQVIRDKFNGKITTTIEQYEKNLTQLVIRLKKTGAKLIWASTTIIPENEKGRFVDDDRKYNEVAAKIMKKFDISINDLHSLTKSFSSNMFISPGDVHYTENGYQKIGKHVADVIMSTLINKY